MSRLLLVLLLALAPAAAAQELLTPGEQVIRDLRAALKTNDDETAVARLGEVGPLYRYPASEEEANALLRAAADATRSQSRTVVVAAIGALAATGAPDARVFIEPFLRTVKKGNEPVVAAAARAAGRLRAPALIPYLLDLAKHKNLVVADQSLLALGEFCHADLAVRRRVTRETLSLCQSLQRNRQRWSRLAASGLRALQRLTGRKLNRLQMFHDWWRVAKTRKDPFG